MTLFSYNGLIAAAQPGWDTAEHPYAYMAANADDSCQLFISSHPFIYSTVTRGIVVSVEGAEVLAAQYEAEAWGEFAAYDGEELPAAVWCNEDILTDLEGLYLEASPALVYDAPLVTVHPVTIDLMNPARPIAQMVQNDKYSRDICFTLLYRGQPWELPIGAKVTVNFQKSDGSGGNYDTMPDGAKAAAIEGNTVTVKLAPQVLTVPGTVKLTIGISSGGTEIHTFVMQILVQPNPGIQAASQNFYKVTGSLKDHGWAPNMILGTDANGDVIAVENPASRMEELVESINATLDEIIGEGNA